MADITPNLKLPYLMAAQAQKHVTHNEAIRALDAFVQLAILDRDLAAPPASPPDGARYIVANAPSGLWAGQAARIAAWQDGVWQFYSPLEGWLAWVCDEDVLLAWSGTAWTPAGGGGGAGGSANPSVVVNGDFQINQRVFAGGSRSAGQYGHDRWKASAAGAASWSVSGATVTLASGELEQVIEPKLWGYTSFASLALTVSVDTPSADMTVTLGAQTGTLTAGSGRCSLTLTLGAGETGSSISLKLKKATGSGVSFANVKLEVGTAATAWQQRSGQAEMALCQRYYRVLANGAQGNYAPWSAQKISASQIVANFALETPMRASPSIVLPTTLTAGSTYPPGASQVLFYDLNTASYIAATGAMTTTLLVSSPTFIVVMFSAGTSWGGNGGDWFQTYIGSSVVVALNAEL